MTQNERDAVLRRYAAGLLGTRGATEAIGARDYADLVSAMARADMDFPKPTMTRRTRRLWLVRAPCCNRSCVMAVEVAIIVTDSPPLITLARRAV